MANNPSYPPHPQPKAKQAIGRPRHRLPDDAIPPEELAVINERDSVDFDAALDWLNGEGPDPWKAGGQEP
jgi:hypothetical protein